jgi:hypothetical protein
MRKRSRYLRSDRRSAAQSRLIAIALAVCLVAAAAESSARVPNALLTSLYASLSTTRRRTDRLMPRDCFPAPAWTFGGALPKTSI